MNEQTTVETGTAQEDTAHESFPISGEVIGYEASQLFQATFEEIERLKQRRELSGKSFALLTTALQYMFQVAQQQGQQYLKIEWE
jgi:hypothetical protein